MQGPFCLQPLWRQKHEIPEEEKAGYPSKERKKAGFVSKVTRRRRKFGCSDELQLQWTDEEAFRDSHGCECILVS